MEPPLETDQTIDVMLHWQQWDQLSPTEQQIWDKFLPEAKCIITNCILGDKVPPAICFAPFPSGHTPTKLALCPPVCRPTHPTPAPSCPSPALVHLHSILAAKFLASFADLSAGRDETMGSLEAYTHQGQ